MEMAKAAKSAERAAAIISLSVGVPKCYIGVG